MGSIPRDDDSVPMSGTALDRTCRGAEHDGGQNGDHLPVAIVGTGEPTAQPLPCVRKYRNA